MILLANLRSSRKFLRREVGSFIRKTAAHFIARRLGKGSLKSVWIGAGPVRRAAAASWGAAALLNEIGGGSTARVSEFLQLERNDEASVIAVLRELVARWFDHFGSVSPTTTVEAATTELAARLEESRSNKKEKLIHMEQRDTAGVPAYQEEAPQVTTERLERLVERLDNNAERLKQSKEQYEQAKTPEERSAAFAAMMNALAGDSKEKPHR